MSSDFLKKFDENLEKLNRQIIDSRKTSDARKKTFEFVAGRLGDLNGKVDKLGEIVDLLKRRADGISSKRGDNSGRVDNNNDEIARLRGIIDGLTRERDDLKRGLDRCNEELKLAKSNIQAEIQRGKNFLDDLRRKCDEEKAELQKRLAGVQPADQQELLARQQQIDQLTEQVRKLTAELDAFKSNVSVPADANKVKQLEDEIAKLYRAMSDQTKNSRQSQNDQEVADCKRELEDLKRKLALFEGEMNIILKERNELRVQLQAATSGSVPVDARIKRLSDDNVRLSAENEMLLKKLNDAQNAIIQATTVLSELSGKDTDFDTIDSLITSLEQMLTDISRTAQSSRGGKYTMKKRYSRTSKYRGRSKTRKQSGGGKQSGGFIYGRRHSTGRGVQSSRRHHRHRKSRRSGVDYMR